MMSHKLETIYPQLSFPFERGPEFGDVLEVAPGVLWLRIPLPYRLDHVNIYLLEDAGGWMAIDAGIRTPEAIDAWEKLLSGKLSGLRISRVLVTHFHPDHIGLAGRLCEKFDAPLLASQTTYMTSRVISLAPHEMGSRQYFDFYAKHGMTEEAASLVAIRGNEYLSLVGELPISFLRLLAGDQLTVGPRQFRVLSGDGHAPEQTMLYCEADGLLFAADQVMERVTPNIGVYAGDQNGDPLGHFLRSQRFLRSEISDRVLVLPGHFRPFHGLHTRCEELEHHHEERCDLIRQACSERPHSIAELMPILFPRQLDPHQTGFAMTETLAHAHRLVRRGEIAEVTRDKKSFFVPTEATKNNPA
ncbi:MAG: MBL fold metallo-hydrolase [Rhizobiaceae bacterium]|nr:MBL fold metallo-hydrolase [Rhizobiaceae bacterium]